MLTICRFYFSCASQLVALMVLLGVSLVCSAADAHPHCVPRGFLSVKTITRAEITPAIKNLPRSGPVEATGNGQRKFFYIQVDKRYITSLFDLLQKKGLLNPCFIHPTDLRGYAHISLKPLYCKGLAKAKAKAEAEAEVGVLKEMVKHNVRLHFLVKSPPIHVGKVKKLPYHHHHHHNHHHLKKMTNTWYVLAVDVDFSPVRNLELTKKQRSALNIIKEQPFHISIAVSKRSSSGVCLCKKLSDGNCAQPKVKRLL